MSKQSFKSLSWNVLYHDFNADLIRSYDVLKHREDFIKKLKKQCETKEEFAEKLKREVQYRYWSKCEWELIIEVDDDNRVWLNPWVGSRSPEKARIEVTAEENFDWHGFAKLHIHKHRGKNSAKIDVFDQLMYKWNEFIDYCWYTRLKYQRSNSKFDK